MKTCFVCLALMLTFAACSPTISDKEEVRSQEELEMLLHAWSKTDSLAVPEIAVKYDSALKEYLENYPGNPTHENFLFMAARNDVNSKNYAAAAEKYSRFYALYPTSRSNADAVFGAAFLYNNEVQNMDSARKYYEIFLLTFPDHLLYDAAQAELEHLGESPEEMLNKLQQSLDSQSN